MIGRNRLVRDYYGETVSIAGTTSKKGKILAWKGDVLAVRWPGGKYWAGRSMQSYAPAYTAIYHYAPEEGGNGWWHEVLTY